MLGMNDQEMKDKILQDLIEKMEDVLSEGMKPEQKGMAVEVAAPDKAHLAQGLDKAKDVLQHAPVPDVAGSKEATPSNMEPSIPSGDEDKSDEERLEDLLGDEDDEDEDNR